MAIYHQEELQLGKHGEDDCIEGRLTLEANADFTTYTVQLNPPEYATRLAEMIQVHLRDECELDAVLERGETDGLVTLQLMNAEEVGEFTKKTVFLFFVNLFDEMQKECKKHRREPADIFDRYYNIHTEYKTEPDRPEWWQRDQEPEEPDHSVRIKTMATRKVLPDDLKPIILAVLTESRCLTAQASRAAEPLAGALAEAFPNGVGHLTTPAREIDTMVRAAFHTIIPKDDMPRVAYLLSDRLAACLDGAQTERPRP